MESESREIMSLRVIATSMLMVVLCSSFASAKQYVTRYHGREVVVHTNPIPVFLHRMVPPQYGRHVTQKEVERGIPISTQQGLTTRSR